MDLSRRAFLGLGVGATALAVETSMLSPALASSCPASLSGTGRFAGDPGAGRLYYGASMPGDVQTFESKMQAQLSVHRTYYQSWQIDSLVANAQDDLAHFRLPHVSIKPPGTWREVARGQHDTWVNNLGSRLAGLGRPMFLTVHHEPENDAGGPGMHGRGFVAMTTHVIRVMRDRAPQVTVVPVLQGWSFSPRSGVNVDRWNVLGAVVFGVDVYNPWSATNGKPWLTFAERLREIQPYANGRPIAIGEYGCRTDPQNPGRAAQWMRDAFSYARNNNIVSMSYFNSNRNSPDGTWELDGERQPVFSDILASDSIARV